MQKAWPFHAFSSVAAQPSNEAKAFVIPITDDNCHVMKLRICRIYGPTLTMPCPFLTLFHFKQAPPSPRHTKEMQPICGRPVVSFTATLCCFSPFTPHPSFLPPASSNFPHSLLHLQQHKALFLSRLGGRLQCMLSFQPPKKLLNAPAV